MWFKLKLEELSSAKETIQKLKHKLENAEAIVNMKADYERQDLVLLYTLFLSSNGIHIRCIKLITTLSFALDFT